MENQIPPIIAQVAERKQRLTNRNLAIVLGITIPVLFIAGVFALGLTDLARENNDRHTPAYERGYNAGSIGIKAKVHGNVWGGVTYTYPDLDEIVPKDLSYADQRRWKLGYKEGWQ